MGRGVEFACRIGIGLGRGSGLGSNGEYERGHLPPQRVRRRAVAQSVGEGVEETGAVTRLPHLQTDTRADWRWSDDGQNDGAE